MNEELQLEIRRRIEQQCGVMRDMDEVIATLCDVVALMAELLIEHDMMTFDELCELTGWPREELARW